MMSSSNSYAPLDAQNQASSGESPARERDLSETMFSGTSTSLGGIAAQDTTTTPGKTSIGTQHDNFRYAEWWYSTLHPAITAKVAATTPMGTPQRKGINNNALQNSGSNNSAVTGSSKSGSLASPSSSQSRDFIVVGTAVSSSRQQSAGAWVGSADADEDRLNSLRLSPRIDGMACQELFVAPESSEPGDESIQRSPLRVSANNMSTFATSPPSSTKKKTNSSRKSKSSSALRTHDKQVPLGASACAEGLLAPDAAPYETTVLFGQGEPPEVLPSSSDHLGDPAAVVKRADHFESLQSLGAETEASAARRAPARGDEEEHHDASCTMSTSSQSSRSSSGLHNQATSAQAPDATVAPEKNNLSENGTGLTAAAPSHGRQQGVRGGAVAQLWVPQQHIHVAPMAALPSPSHLFSYELEVFVANRLRLNNFDVANRMRLVQLLETIVIQTLGSGTKLEVHGSFATGLALRTSDMDFLVTGYQGIQPLAAIERTTNALLAYSPASLKSGPADQKSGLSKAEQDAPADDAKINGGSDAAADGAVTSKPTWSVGFAFPQSAAPIEGDAFIVQTIIATRVPVVKVVEKATGLKADISFGGGDHWNSMELTKKILTMHPTCASLLLLLKYCVKRFGIGESEGGGMTSFPLYLLVSHFFQEGLNVVSAVRNGKPSPPAPHGRSTSPAPAVVNKQAANDMQPTGDSEEINSLVTRIAGGEQEIAMNIRGYCEGQLPLPPPPPPVEELAPPSVSTAVIPPPPSIYTEELTVDSQSSSLGQVLFDFCVYYRYFFDYDRAGLRFDPDGTSHVVEKPLNCVMRNQHLHMTSPFDASFDLTARMPHTRDFSNMCMGLSTLVHCPGTLHSVLHWISPDTMMEDLSVVNAVICHEQYLFQQQQQQRYYQQHHMAHHHMNNSSSNNSNGNPNRGQVFVNANTNPQHQGPPPQNVGRNFPRQGVPRGRGSNNNGWLGPPGGNPRYDPMSRPPPPPATEAPPSCPPASSYEASNIQQQIPSATVSTSTGTMTSIPQTPPIVPPTMVAGARGYLVPFTDDGRSLGQQNPRHAPPPAEDFNSTRFQQPLHFPSRYRGGGSGKPYNSNQNHAPRNSATPPPINSADGGQGHFRAASLGSGVHVPAAAAADTAATNSSSGFIAGKRPGSAVSRPPKATSEASTGDRKNGGREHQQQPPKRQGKSTGSGPDSKSSAAPVNGTAAEQQAS